MVTEVNPIPDGVTNVKTNAFFTVLAVLATLAAVLVIIALATGVRGGHGHGGSGNGTAPGVTQIIGHPKGGKSK